MSRPLEPYIQEINRHGHYFPQTTSHKSPQLQPGKLNRILVYSGCFNPPHIGHASLLQHVFSNSGKDLNIIAAIVMPKDDRTIERKLKGRDGQLKLTKSERVMLWNGHEPSDYFWVFAAENKYWKEFQHKLLHNIRRDGFEVRMSALWGAEYLKDETFFDYPWGFFEIFASDISRDSTIMPPGQMAPRRLQGHTSWKRTLITDEPANGASVWTCCATIDRPFHVLRFLPKPENNRVLRTSSTEIRESLQNVHNLRSGELRGYARDLVLRPDLLFGILFKPSP